jgi:signal transduction histidine kinase
MRDPDGRDSADADADADARQRAEELRQMVEAAPIGMLVADASGKVIRANRMAEALLGGTGDQAIASPGALAGGAPGSLIGASIDRLLPQAVAQPVAQLPQHLPGAAHNARPATPGTWQPVTLQRGDGAALALDVLRTPIGASGATLTSIIEVTERRRREHELVRSNAELAQLAHVAAHDLQEPLRTVASYAELLVKRYRGRFDARADKYLDYTVAGARRMQRLVADLLGHARVGSHGRPLAPVALDAVLAEVRELFAIPLDEAGATLEIHGLPTVMGDADQLFRLFQNLISNAVKFRAARPLVITIAAAREAERWRISVADNGLGIAAEDAPRIFEMFQRLHTRDEHEGSGLGLALAKRIAERHRGRIWVDAERDRGATFHLTLLPVSEPAP